MADIYNSQLDAFDLYHLYNQRTQSTSLLDGPALPALGHALAGAAGSAISNTAVYPLDLIITRLQLQQRGGKHATGQAHYTSIADAFHKIYTTEGGWSALYTGVREDTAKSIADSFLFFLAYNFLRQGRLQRRGANAKHLPAIDELAVGFVAGAFSKILTTPIGNVVTRLQASSEHSHSSNASPKATAASIARKIRREKGLIGFWSGYSASLILTLNPSLTFFFFESLKRLTLPRASRDHPPPSATFILAALSKALASTITYPFSLAKSRAQMSARSPQDPETVKEETKAPGQAPASVSKRGVNATVFATIATIARTDGISALYEGLSGEVLKGFFSHGITMLVKESMHRLIIRLYYLGLQWLQRFPEARVTAQRATSSVQHGAKTVQQSAEAATEATRSKVGAATEVTRSTVEAAAAAARDGAQNAVQAAREQMDTAAAAANRSKQGIKEAAIEGMSRASDSTEQARQRAMQEIEAGSSTFLNVIRKVGGTGEK